MKTISNPQPKLLKPNRSQSRPTEMAALLNWASLSLHQGSTQQHSAAAVTTQTIQWFRNARSRNKNKQLVETLITVLFHPSLSLEQERLLLKSPLSSLQVTKTSLHHSRLRKPCTKHHTIHKTSRKTITKTTPSSKTNIKLRITPRFQYQNQVTIRTMVKSITNRMQGWLLGKEQLQLRRMFLQL